jgi:phosphatidylserine synthase 2
MAVLIVISLELICELNAFYLKYLLWIPVSSNLNVYRLLFMFLMCLPACRETYQFLTDPKCKRLGMHAWLTTVKKTKIVNYCHRALDMHQIRTR